MPWQRLVADVVGEVNPDTGQLVYDELILTVPRQSGKSTWVLAKSTHRATATDFFGPRQHLVYTAQTREKAREKFDEDFLAELEASRVFRSRVKRCFRNGSEHIRFQNMSRFGIEANTESAGHGSTLDEAYVDEAFVQVDNRLEQAFSPAMITRPNTLTVIVSTAGWVDGPQFLWEKVQRGRDEVALGHQSGTAYFEWSAPDDADPADPATWWSCMPALGHTITENAIRSEFRKLRLADFRRAYLNQWLPKDDDSGEEAVDPEVWAHLAGVEGVRPSPVAISIEVSTDRKWSHIGLAGRRSDGSVHVQVVQSGKGTAWVPGRVAELASEWNPVGVTLRQGAPAGSLVSDLSALGIEPELLSVRDAALACGMLSDLVDQGSVHHDSQRHLDISVRSSRWRRTGELRSFKSADDTIDITPLWSVATAVWALGKHRESKRSGVVW